MKKKLCCILVLIVLLLNSSIMLVISEAVDAVQTSIEKAENIKALAEINLTKYENFDTTTENSDIGSKGVLVQFNLKTGIEFAEGQEYKPIQKTNTNIELPFIGNNKPERVEVLTKSTQATNGGKEAVYVYDASTGILEIKAENAEYSENVSNARDEYEIICIYKDECYSSNNEEISFDVKVNIEEILKDEASTQVNAKAEQKYTVTENINGTISVEHQTEEIYNGYITANYLNSENKYETTYNEKLNIMISNKQIAQKVEIKESSEKSLYIETSIDKNKVLEVLGDKGSIEILDENGNILKTINKDTETDENGKIKVTYENRVSNITVQIKDIAKEGIIEVQNVRVIEPTVQVIDNKISTQVYIKGINTITREVQENDKIEKEIKTEELVKYERQEQIDTEIKQALSNIEAKLDNDVLVNNTENNIILTATLRTDNPKYSLFKNPTISIEMPSEVEKIVVNTPDIMYDNKIFKLEETSVDTNNGNKIFNMKLQGEQTSYEQTSVIEGTNIRIPLTIKLKRNIENKVGIMKIRYSNEMTSSTESRDLEVSLLNKVVNIPFEPIVGNENSENQIQNPTESENAGIIEQDGVKVEIIKEVGNNTVPNNGIIYEQQIIKNKIKITNSSNIAKKVFITVNVPDELAYVKLKTGGFNKTEEGYYEYIDLYSYEKQEEKQVKIEMDIKAGESKTDYIEFKVNDLLDDVEEKQIDINYDVQINGNSLTQLKTKNVIKQATVVVELGCHLGIRNRKNWGYALTITNVTNKELKNVKVAFEGSDEIDISEIMETGEQDITKYSGNIWQDTIETLKPSEEYRFYLDTTAKNIDESKGYEYEVTGVAAVQGEGIPTYFSNKTDMTGYIEGIELDMTADKEKLNAGDEVTYTVNIKNVGKTWGGFSIYTDMRIQNLIPRELQPISLTYNEFIINKEMIPDKTSPDVQHEVVTYKENQGVTKDLTNLEIPEGYDEEDAPNIDLYLAIPEGKTVTMVIKAKAKRNIEDKEITNTITAKGDYITTKTASVTNTILKYVNPDDIPNIPIIPEEPDKPIDPEKPIDPDKPIDPENPNKPATQKVSISGIAWIDGNEDGKRTTDEQIYSKMKVMLFDYKNNTFVKENGQNKQVETNDKGEYKFENIDAGQYIVVFLYDTNMYLLTEYQKEGVLKSKDNDAITKTIEIDGKTVNAGLTNILVADTNLTNIDIGLIESREFDFEIQKYISKITVQTKDNKIKTYEYDNKQFAKVEIHSKKINGATVIIEYKMVVMNKGQLPGKVVSVKDKLPEGLKFKSELNNSWYENEGELVTNNLSGQIIGVGESREIPLVLTKEIDGNNIGLITNEASIGISSNDRAIEDNNVQNNTSSAQVFIGVSTGLLKWLGITLQIVAVLAILGILIWKNKKILKSITFIMIFALVLIGGEEKVFGAEFGKPWDTVTFSTSENDVIWLNPEKTRFTLKQSHGNDGETYKCHSKGAQWSLRPLTGTLIDGWQNSYWKQGGNWQNAPEAKELTLENVTDSNNVKFEEGIKVGPFKIKYNIERNEIKDLTAKICYESYSGGNSNYTVNIVNEVIDETSHTSTFYLDNIPADITRLISVEITCKYDMKQIMQGSEGYSKIEYAIGNGYQIMGRSESREFYEEKTIQKAASITINGTWSPVGDLELIKYDADNPEKVLKNAQFKLQDKTGKYLVVKNSAGEKIDKISSVEFNQKGGVWGVINKPESNNGFELFSASDIKDGTTFVTDESGRIIIKNLVCNPYKFIEVDNLNYGYTEMVEVSENVNALVTVTCKLKNEKKVGNIEITKIDEDIPDKVLAGVEFVLKSSYQNKYIKVKASGDNVTTNSDGWVIRAVGKVRLNDTSENDINPTIAYTDSIEEATKFVTDENGYLRIENLLMSSDGKDEIQYQLLEVKNPNYGYLVYENGKVEMNHGVKFTGNSVTSDGYATIPRNETTNITITNKQEYIRIEGYVWEETPNSKDNQANNVYENNIDALVEGINVYLYKDGKIVATRVTDENGRYMFGTKKEKEDSYVNEDYLTESNGNLKIADLDKYYVEFEYDGLRFTSVEEIIDYLHSNYENTSKAKEVERGRTDRKDRTSVNEDFAVISNNKSNKYQLNYDFAENKSTYKDYWGYEYNENKTRLKVTPAKYYEIIASTQESGFNLKTAWETKFKGKEEVTGINLGIYRRDQADVAISEDLEEMNIVVNNGKETYENTYTYGNREIDKNEEGFGVEVKFGNKVTGNYSNRGLNLYTRRIYESDLALAKENPELMKIYVTYKIKVKNQSTVDAKVIELVNYYDSRYLIEESWIGDNKAEKANWTTNSSYSSKNIEEGYTAVYTKALENKVIEPNGYIDINIKFRLNNDAVKALIQKQTTLNNVTEINAFSSLKNNKPYAAIDEDSNPGSAEINLIKPSTSSTITLQGREYEIENKKLDTKTYEDDTDLAPSLVLGIEEAEPTRGLSGTVFEDNNINGNDTQTGKERKGDGILKEDRNRIKNAKVELLNEDGSIVKLYKLAINNGTVSKVVEDAITYTNEKGEYNFLGVVPGRYLIRYTYGEFDKDGTIIKTEIIKEGNAVPIDVRNYKSTIITSDIMKTALSLGKEPIRKGDLNWIVTYDGIPANGTIEKKFKSADAEEIIRYSDAVDDIETRKKLDEVYNGNMSENKITADTAYFDVGVEYSEVKQNEGFNIRESFTDYKDEYKLDNGKIVVVDENGRLQVAPTFYAVNPYQDFGIIERPRQVFDVNKRVSNIKITLANGQVLLDGNPYKQIADEDLYEKWDEIEKVGEALPYVKALPGQVIAEIDNELLQGATLNVEYTISIKNDSEIDYEYKDNQDYYYYGNNPTNILKVIKRVVDYMEDGLIYEETQNQTAGWTKIEPEKLEIPEIHQETIGDKQLIKHDEVCRDIKQGYTIAITNTFYDEEFKPETVKSIKMYGSKLLSTNENGIAVSNHTEIIETARRLWETSTTVTPGNYNPRTQTPNESDDGQTKIIITPPTGITNKNIIIISTISITFVALVVLGTGIYFIKKKVLK